MKTVRVLYYRIKYRLSICLIALVCYVCLFVHAHAAQADEHIPQNHPDQIYFWELIASTYSAANRLAEQQTSIGDIKQLLTKQCNESSIIESSRLQLLQEADFWDQSYGVELRGGLVTDDLDASELGNDGNTYLELSWDVLSNGMREFDHRAKNLRREAAAQRIQDDLKQTGQSAQCRHYNVTKAFAGSLSRLYNAKLQLMEPVLEVEKRAYFEGLSYLDELFISEEQLVNLRLRLQKLNSIHMDGSVPTAVFHPAIVDINIDKLIDDLNDDPRFAKLIELDERTSQRYNPYRNGNRLRFFVRKELDVFSSERDDLVAGFRFSIPLNFAERPTYLNSMSALQREAELELWERQNRVRSNYEAYVDQLERTISQHYRYLRASEKMRRMFNRRADGESLVISAAVVRTLNYVDAIIELLEAKHTMFDRFNNVILASRLEFKPQYITPLHFSNKSDRARPYQRGIYIWSSTFNSLDNQRLTRILDNQQIETIYLSNSRNLDREKAQSFLEVTQEIGVKVVLITGDNSWFLPEKHQNAASKVAAVGSISGRIHLDIEPQALPGYDGNEKKHQQWFVEMIEQIRYMSPDLYLSIAVPFHWHPETYEKLNPLIDEFVIMNYGDVSDEARVRRLNKLLDYIEKSKVHTALRPEDFDSPFAMESTLSLIQQATGLDKFVLHDLKSLIDTLNRGEGIE